MLTTQTLEFVNGDDVDRKQTIDNRTLEKVSLHRIHDLGDRRSPKSFGLDIQNLEGRSPDSLT